jgi:hydroxyacylglutathione hydrolase
MDTVKSVEPDEFVSILKLKDVNVLDVRRIAEAEDGHVKNAMVIPLAELTENMDAIEKSEPVYLHCRTGHRSMIATSMLQAAGIRNIIHVNGGWVQFKDSGVPIEKGAPANISDIGFGISD